MSAAERGTLHHGFLQKIDLSRAGSSLELKSQANRMMEAGDFTADEFAAIDYEALAEFWVTPLGRQICANAAKVERELPFTIRLGTAELRRIGLGEDAAELGEKDFVVVQGVVDLAVIGDEAILVLDYKTDSMNEDGVAEKVEHYGPQLRLYAHALAAIYRRPVTGAWLHFLAVGKSVDVMAV